MTTLEEFIEEFRKWLEERIKDEQDMATDWRMRGSPSVAQYHDWRAQAFDDALSKLKEGEKK